MDRGIGSVKIGLLFFFATVTTDEINTAFCCFNKNVN